MRPSTANDTSRTIVQAVVLVAAAVQGLSVVAIPASATVLQSAIGLPSAAYGELFVAQTFAAIVGALAGEPLARRIGHARALAVATSKVAAWLQRVRTAPPPRQVQDG